MKLLDPDSPIMSFLARVADLVILNVLWLLCCLPVVTAGASTTAMYHVVRHLQEESISSVTRDFFRSFKSDFRQATPVYLLLLIPTAAVVMNAWILSAQSSDVVPVYVRAIWMVSALMLTFVVSFVYPVMAYFDDTVWKTLRTAAVLAVAKLPRTVLISAINLLPIIMLFVSLPFFLRSSIFWLLIGGSLTAYLNMLILRPVFKKIIDERPGADAPDSEK
jgi:hypothetical protein